METPHILVIGYGNTLRSDDGAGIALAKKLVAHWLAAGVPAQLHISTQLLPEMAADIGSTEVEAVVFVDATAQNSSRGIQYAKIEACPTSPSMGHNLDSLTLLVYTGLLYGHYPSAWLVTIPGFDFVHGQDFSPQVTEWLCGQSDDQDAVAAIALQLLKEIKETSQCTNSELLSV